MAALLYLKHGVARTSGPGPRAPRRDGRGVARSPDAEPGGHGPGLTVADANRGRQIQELRNGVVLLVMGLLPGTPWNNTPLSKAGRAGATSSRGGRRRRYAAECAESFRARASLA